MDSATDMLEIIDNLVSTLNALRSLVKLTFQNRCECQQSLTEHNSPRAEPRRGKTMIRVHDPATESVGSGPAGIVEWESRQHSNVKY